MWKLEHLTNMTGQFLQHGCDMAVSRQDGCWLQLPADASISRKHALLRVQHSPQAVKRNVPSTVELQDINAKNGTYIKRGHVGDGAVEFTDADRLQAGTTVTLNDGDIVRFGLYTYCYRLVRHPLVVVTSMLGAADTNTVLVSLLLLGSTFSKEFTGQCTHLVMESIKLSAKVSCALASGASIVTPAFLTTLCSTVKNKKHELPPHTPYLPPITEPGIQPKPSLFERNKERKRILKGLRFLFASQRTFKRLSSIVLSAGGSCGLLSCQDHTALAAGQALLVRGMEDSAASASQGSPFTAAVAVVRKAGLNPVPESDIALAVLYCSTDRFCNPALSQQNLVAPPVSQSQQESLVVFAPGTESFSASPLPPSRPAALVARTKNSAMVPDTPASTAPRPSRTDSIASTITGRSAKTAVQSENKGETSRMQIRDENQSVDVSVLGGGGSIDATPSLSLPSPARQAENSPRRSRLSMKRGRTSEDSSNSAEEGAPVPKRSTAAAAPIEPTQDIAPSQDDERTLPFGCLDDISGLEMSQFAPKDASTQKMEVESILPHKTTGVAPVQAIVAAAAEMISNPPEIEIEVSRTTNAVTTIPPTPTPPVSQHFPSSISVPPTPTPPISREPITACSPSRATSGPTTASSLLSPPVNNRVNQRKQRQEAITLSTLPSLPAESYVDASLCPGISDEPPPTLDPPSLPDRAWLATSRRSLSGVNDVHRGRRNFNTDAEASAILDPPPSTAVTNARADGHIKVERSEPRDANVFQMPSAQVRRRKTKQAAEVPPPAANSSSTAVIPPPGGIKRSRSTVAMEQDAIEPSSRRIKCEPATQPESAAVDLPQPRPTQPPATQGFLSKPTRVNGCNNTTLGLNVTTTAAAVVAPQHSTSVISSSNAGDSCNEDVKPDPEVTRLSRTFVVSLVVRTSILGDKYSPPGNDTTVSGKKNFKRFKKVTSTSFNRPSQAMPRIIGGRDLKPHTAFYTETDVDARATERMDSLRATWLSQHPDASSYLDQEEQDRQERLREDWDDYRDQGSIGRGGRSRGGSTMMSYFTAAPSSSSSSASIRSAPAPSTDASGLSVFRMPVSNVRKRQRR